jgi:CRP-like cAMP-binding protein
MTTRIHTNLILASLPAELQRSIAKELQPRRLQGHDEIPLGADVIFPVGGVLSLLKETASGDSVEGAVIGYDGVLALRPFDGLRVLVQVPGECLVMSREAYTKRLSDPSFESATGLYRDSLLNSVLQMSACVAFHPANERLAVWLLAMFQRSKRDSMELTHEFLSSMLGVSRPTVSLAAQELQDRGLIEYRYGEVRIRDLIGLEHAACECYAAVGRIEHLISS